MRNSAEWTANKVMATALGMAKARSRISSMRYRLFRATTDSRRSPEWTSLAKTNPLTNIASEMPTSLREMAEKFLGFGGEEFSLDESRFNQGEILGKELLFRGWVKKNEGFERLEFVVKGYGEVDVDKEIKMLKGDEK